MSEKSLEQLLVDFLNTVDVEAGTDVLTDVRQWQEWAAERAMIAGSPGLAADCRLALRDLAMGTPLVSLPELPLVVGIAPDGAVELRAADGATEVCSSVLAAVATLGIQGRLDRVKICPADDCLWAFYDQSRNRSRQWCSMASCGNRAKTKAFRSRGHRPADS